ncbi:UPF0052 domain protein [Diplogelasinospora grovesii]|uniref:UPF0052 domain protein n=1 Tax=Diplogelasinospora grovesii TaxID=303347 RepID=A0AAN6NEP4_9PEZI|nr:UPF0052 domain protein [Diplogelasinospora grovesii]
MDTRMDGAVTPNGTSVKIPGITVFSGGTAANSLVDVFNTLVAKRGCQCQLNYVIPISDNGGSSSELIRFVGGPSVGDVRSRLVRLIPNHDTNAERSALKTLFEYRLCSDPLKARSEWLDIVEARSLLWTFISSPKRELIRSILNTLNLEIVKRARPTSAFNFAEASIGNMFLTGARIFSGSFESAICLLSMICSIPETVAVLPAINSNFTHHICAGLADGTSIAGQVNISHPSAPTALPDDTVEIPALTAADHDRIEDANLPGSLPILRRQHITFSKDDEEDLPARIERLWYINPYGHEIWPVPNPKVLQALGDSDTVIYSIGSLYTSIIPSLVLKGVGQAIANPRVKKKVLILNGRLDRETGPKHDAMTAVDFARAIARAGAESWMPKAAEVIMEKGEMEEAKGLLRKYVTHLVYLEDNEQGPKVDVRELGKLGVICVKVHGKTVGEGRRAVLRYDEVELGMALEGIIEC